MKIERKFTKVKTGAYGEIEFKKTKSEIRNPAGSIVFELDDMEVPVGWSQVAADVIAQKYFRKARSEERRVGKGCRSRSSPYH